MLTGQLVTLRGPFEEDLPRLLELRTDVPLQTCMMAVARPHTMTRVREWLSQKMSDTHAAFFIIADRASDTPHGFIQAVGLDLLHGIGKLGLGLMREAQGRGVAAEALTLFERYLHDRFRLRKLILEVLSTNERAIRFYHKHAYRTVGAWQQHFYADGVFHDVTLMEKFLAQGAPS